jgi:hypothetical protein
LHAFDIAAGGFGSASRWSVPTSINFAPLFLAVGERRTACRSTFGYLIPDVKRSSRPRLIASIWEKTDDMR